MKRHPTLLKKPDLDAGQSGLEMRRKKAIFRLLTVGLTLLILTLAIVLVFHIQTIKVTGNQYCTKEEVVKWLQKDKLSSNSLYVWLKYNYTDAEKLPFMEDCEIRLENRWTVEVQVYEKSITGYLELNNQFIYFDKDGTVLKMSDQASVDEIPRIEGIDVVLSEVKEFSQLPVTDKKIFSNVLDVTKEVQNNGLTPDRILFEDGEATLVFGNIKVVLGQDNMTEKIAQIQPILEKLAEKHPDITGVLHLENYSKDNQVINFQPQEEQNTSENQSTSEGQSTSNGEKTDSGDDSEDDGYVSPFVPGNSGENP